jgi:hypothetical protein
MATGSNMASGNMASGNMAASGNGGFLGGMSLAQLGELVARATGSNIA